MVKYAVKKFNKEHMAKVMGRNLPMSFKQTVEACNFIRGKKVSGAKEILKKVSEKKVAMPFRRFNGDVGHKKKIGPGRFPFKVSNELIKLLEAVEANAQFKGLNTSNLTIMHICAHKGSKTWHFGRKRRRQMKRTNVEIVAEEKAGEKGKEKPKKDVKVEKKGEVKPEAKEKPKVKEEKKETKPQETKEGEKSTGKKINDGKND